MPYPPPVWLRHKTRGFPNGPLLEEMWDSGGRKMKNGRYVGGDYFRSSKDGTVRTPFLGTFGVPGTPEWTYPNRAVYASDPDRYQFDYTWSGNPVFVWPNFEDINAHGPSAWNRMRPDKPDLSLLNVLWETRDISRSLKPRILEHRDSKAWADFHLAVQFGWLPTLADTQDLVRTVLSLKKRLDQLVRDNGKLVHRTYRFKAGNSNASRNHTQTVMGETYAAFLHGMVTQVHKGVPQFVDTLSAGIDTWASGNFRYYLPEGRMSDWRWKTSMYGRILGASPSPSTVWKAIPWSWLADWFTNIGDVLDNIDFSVADRLVSESSFIMQRRWEKYTRVSTGTLWAPDGSTLPVSASTMFIKESKQRSIIDPFGPAIDNTSMSDLQASILGAIGLTHMPSEGGGYRGFDPSTRNPIGKIL